MDKNGNLNSGDTYDSDFSIDEIKEQTKGHFEELEKLMSNDTSVDFTDEEFRGMLGYIIGYTSEEATSDFKELRKALIEEVRTTTGKDLTKCWIWM